MGKAGLNVLVNNTWVLTHGTMQTTSTQEIQAAFNTNILGPMDITKVRAESQKNTHTDTF